VALPWLIPTRLNVEGLTTWLVILCATNIILAIGVKMGNKVKRINLNNVNLNRHTLF
jgi:hypothetical protein